MSTLRGRPGSALWLMGHELRLFWRRGASGGRSGLIIAGLLLLGWMLFSYSIFSKAGPAIPPPPLGDSRVDGLALLIASFVILFISSVMLSQSILAAIEAIYTRNDLDLLISSPLKPWTVLVVRTTAIAINSLPIYAALLGPPLIWLAIFNSPLWLFSLLFLVLLAFAATGLALLVVTGLFRLLGPKRTRVLAQITGALTGASIFLGFQFFNIYGRDGGEAGGQSGGELAAVLQNIKIDTDAPWFLPARAMTADPLAMLLWTVFSIAVFLLGVSIFSRRFVQDAAAASTMGQRRKQADNRVQQVRGGLMATIMRKELRLILRDPLLLSQVGLQLVYLLPIAFLLVRPQDGGGLEVSIKGFAPALTVLASALAGSLIWITVSAEDAPDLIASAPAARKVIDRSKIIAAAVPALALIAIPVALLGSREPVAGLWAAGGCIAAAASAACIGLWRRTSASRRDFVRRRQKGSAITSMGQTFTAVLIAAAAGFGAYDLPLMAIIPAIFAATILGVMYRTPAERGVTS
jgi:ABC-2 type transport system permease protein